MKQLAIVLALGCAAGRNTWIPYAPIAGSTARADAVQRITVALTDAGRDIASTDNGVVLSAWFAGDAVLVGDETRFRMRAILASDGGWRLDALCQRREVIDKTKWTDCVDDAKRPRFVVDLLRQIERALR